MLVAPKYSSLAASEPLDCAPEKKGLRQKTRVGVFWIHRPGQDRGEWSRTLATAPSCTILAYESASGRADFCNGDLVNYFDPDGRCADSLQASLMKWDQRLTNFEKGHLIDPLVDMATSPFAQVWNYAQSVQRVMNDPLGIEDGILDEQERQIRGYGNLVDTISSPSKWTAEGIGQGVSVAQNIAFLAYSGFEAGTQIPGGFSNAPDMLPIPGAADPLPVPPRPPLAQVFDDMEPQQGFSGVYDRETGKVLIRPSTDEAEIPEGWVARRGGHADVSEELGGDPANHSGFAVILQEDGSLNVTWRSGTLNPPPSNLVPPLLRPSLIDALEGATGKTVNQ